MHLLPLQHHDLLQVFIDNRILILRVQIYRLVIALRSIFISPFISVNLPQIIVGLCLLGIKHNAMQVHQNGLGVLLKVMIDQSQVEIGLGKFRVEFDALEISLDGLRILLVGIIQNAEIVVGFGVLRTNLNGLPVGFYSLPKFTLIFVDDPQIIIGGGVVGVELNRFDVELDGLHVPLQIIKDIPYVEITGVLLRVQLDRLYVKLCSLTVIAQGGIGVPQLFVCDDAFGVKNQGFAIYYDCLLVVVIVDVGLCLLEDGHQLLFFLLEHDLIFEFILQLSHRLSAIHTLKMPSAQKLICLQPKSI